MVGLCWSGARKGDRKTIGRGSWKGREGIGVGREERGVSLWEEGRRSGTIGQ